MTVKGKGFVLGMAVFMSVLLFLSAQVYAAPQAGTGGLRYTVAVSSFENRSNVDGLINLGDAWGAVLTDALNQTGRFNVLGEKDMRFDSMQEGGQKTPAQILIKGVVTHAQNTNNSGGGFGLGGFVFGGSSSSAEMNITMYMVDTESGRVIASKNVVGKSNSGGVLVGTSGAVFGTHSKDNMGKAMEHAIAQGVNWMVEQLPKIKWTGNVVLAKDGQVYVNRGTREGVSVGQEFIIGSTDVLKDPVTGEILDEVMKESARVRVVTVKEKISICEFVFGNEAQTGMKVLLP